MLNVLFWIVTSWIITQGFSIEGIEYENIYGVVAHTVIRNSSMVLQLLICIGFSFILFYTNLWNVLQLIKGRHKSKIALISAALLISAIGSYSISDYFCRDSLPLQQSLTFGTIIFFYTISTAYGLGKVWIQAETLRKKLTLEKKEAELTLLRNQLQPHFLFNVLNNLLATVDQQKNPLVADSLERLSSLLRYVVYDTASNKVQIKKEINFIKNFAELQLLRFEKDEVEFNLDIKGDFDHQEIEPGIFIPFIENAFKYGTEPEKYSEINVRFDLSDKSKIKFRIVNPIFPAMQQNGNGSGILSTKERLNLVYPNKHQLLINKTDFFILELKIETE
ncbi:MAG: histidine kinase [Ignavibacteriaceae bacterium]